MNLPRKAFAALMMTAAAAVLAGCPAGTGANIPGTGGTLGGSTTTPGGTTTTTTTTTTPTADACPRSVSPNAARGTSVHGKYNNQLLPEGWSVQYKTEAEVTTGITNLYQGADWACFQKFYPGATVEFKSITGKV